jgi:hypothetical protein
MKGFKRYLFVGGLIITAYLVAQYFKPRPTNWAPTYLSEDKIPFGTYILRQQIRDIFPGTVVLAAKSDLYHTLKEKPEGKSNYLIIASDVKIEKLDYQEMVRYMKSGNNIFVAAFQFSGVLLDTLKLNLAADFNLATQRKHPVNFVNPTLKREYDYYFDKAMGNQYFNEIDTASAIVLGQKDEVAANFVQYRFGKGSLFILPNPQLLTNYSLLKDDGRDYASKALSYLPKADTLILDEYFTGPGTQDQSMLRVLFEKDQLRWAYYIALWSLVAFVVYEIKRRQRIIPVIERLKNTSVEFAQVIGRVYYQQRNNKDIADKKVTYLLAYIRNKYRLKTTELNQDFKAALIKVSGASSQVIEDLFNEMIYIGANKVSDQQLINLNKIIEQFYKQDQ